MKPLLTLPLLVALVGLGGCAFPRAGIRTESSDRRTDSLALHLETVSNATLHGVTVIAVPAPMPALKSGEAATVDSGGRKIVRIERVEINRRESVETVAASTQESAETISEVPAPEKPGVTKRLRRLILISLTAIAAALLLLRCRQ